MSCESCRVAEREPRSAQFSPGCDSCIARAVAATRGDLLEDYRGAIERLFGPRMREGHALVKRWVEKVRQFDASEKARGA